MDNQPFPQPPPLAPVNTSEPAPVPENRRPDPGSKGMASIALIVATFLILIVFGVQQWNVQKLSAVKPDPSQASNTSIFTIYAKGFTKMAGVFAKMLQEQDGKKAIAPFAERIEEMAQTPDEKLRAAIAGAEIADAEKAVDMLDAAETWVKTQEDLNTSDSKKGFKLEPDVRRAFEKNRELLLRYYRQKVSEDKKDDNPPPGLTTAEFTELKNTFGWFGRVASVYGKPDAPERASLFRYAEGILILLVVLGCAMVLAALLGIVLFIVALVALMQGSVRWRFVPPAPGGSVYLETVAVFVGSFLALQILVHVLAVLLLPKGTTEPPSWFNVLHLALQWLLALVPLYPLLRGVSFQRWRDDIGYVAPNGIFREIGCGLFAYFAGLPIFMLGFIITLILKLMLDMVKSSFGEDSGAPATNPIFDEILGNNPLGLVLLVSLATIWAPFVEETIFRGALFRHLRSRTVLFLAAIVSAIVFGVLHGYEVVLLGPVISLGFVFAFMREWRKSLIPSITAHMLHNGTIMFFAITMLRMVAAE